jgi:hypothetical protein
MSTTNSSKIEKAESMQLYHSDGGLDIIAGSVLLNLGLDVLNQAATTSLFTWIPILLLSSMKNRFSVPRIGYKALKADDKIVRSWTTQTAIGLAIWLLVLGTLLITDPFHLEDMFNLPWEGDFRNLVFAAVGGTSLAAAGWLIPLRRFYLYAGVAFVSSLISYFLLPVYAPIFITATVMVVIGIKMTMSFSRTYPDPEKDKAKNDNKDSKKG